MKCKGTFDAEINVDIKDEQKKSVKASKEKLLGNSCGLCMGVIIGCILAILAGAVVISYNYFPKKNSSANGYLPVPENSVSENVKVETSSATIYINNESLKKVETKNNSMDWFLYIVLMAACVWAVCFLCFLFKELCIKASKLRYLKNAFDNSDGKEEPVEIENVVETKDTTKTGDSTQKNGKSENQSGEFPKAVVTSKKQIPSMERFKIYSNTLQEI